MSNFYLDVIKDRLYVEKADSICVDSENQETKDKNQTLCETFRKKDCGCPV